MNFLSVCTFLKCAICLGVLIPVCYGGETCSATYGGLVVSKYCDIGGCCTPSTVTEKTDPDELCCITTLTVILVGSFVGGPLLIMTIVCSGVCIKRYCEKKKNDDRVQETENARQERRRERRRQRQQQEQEEEAIRIRRYYEPLPEDGPMAPPAYDAEPPGSVPARRAAPLSPPPAYEAIVQETTLPNQRGQGTSHFNEVSQSGGGHIDVTIHAPSIGGRRTKIRASSNNTNNGVLVARNGIPRQESVHRNQVSPNSSFRDTTNNQSSEVAQGGGEPIDVTIHAPSIGGRRPKNRTKLEDKKASEPFTKNAESRQEYVQKSQMSSNYNGFKDTPSPVSMANGRSNSELNGSKSFSRPRQIVTDASAEEPADLLYI